jgi:uncharacterized protein (TIGR03546 family)
MIGLKFLGKIIKAIKSTSSPTQIAGGFILGMMIGLISLKSLISAVVVILIIILNVNVAMAVAGYAIFRLIAWLVDPWLHSLGYLILVDLEALRGAWTYIYGIPVVSFTRFNNTIVMGGLAVSAVIIVPLFVLMKKFTVLYRERWAEKIQRWKIVQAVKGSKIFEWVGRITRIGA